MSMITGYAATAAFARRLFACRQLDYFVHRVGGVVHRHLNDRVALLDRHPCRFRIVIGRIRRLDLPIDLEAITAAFRPLALPQMLGRGFFLIWSVDRSLRAWSRCHCVVLLAC